MRSATVFQAALMFTLGLYVGAYVLAFYMIWPAP